MTAGSTVGLVVMLGAVIWCLASLARVVVGPRRKAALGNSAKAVLIFFAGGIVVGLSGTETASRSTATPPVVEASTSTPSTVSEAPQPQTTVTAAGTATALATPSTAVLPHVTARYQTSNTLVSLVIADFTEEAHEELRAIAVRECAGASFCSVGFWTSDEMAPRTLKMTDETVASRLAHYVHSQKTGLDTLKWNCRVAAGTKECL